MQPTGRRTLPDLTRPCVTFEGFVTVAVRVTGVPVDTDPDETASVVVVVDFPSAAAGATNVVRANAVRENPAAQITSLLRSRRRRG
jgi:hypothetical protein